MEKGSRDDYFEGSKSSYSNKDVGEDEGGEEGEEVDKSCKQLKSSGCSTSNSSIEESENKKAATGSVRRYIRSKMPRLRWTPDLHLRFIHAVERLGGQDGATPKLVLQMMNIKGLSIAHVKSHLQMYRSKKLDYPNQGQGFLFEGGDHHIYNLSQLPLLRNLNQRPSLSLRYGDVSWRGHDHHRIYSPYMGGKELNRADRQGFYGSIAERLLGCNSYNTIIPDSNIGSTIGLGCRAHQSLEELKSFSTPSSTDPNFIIKFQERKADQVDCLDKTSFSNNRNERSTVQEMQNRLKWNALDAHCNLDLNLSLKVKTKDDEALGKGLLEGDRVDSSLSLSLSSSSASPQLSRLKEGDYENTKHARKASTLDLTL